METPVNKPSRSISADFVKAISIFGVVFIHGSYLLGCVSAISETILASFRFGVPCFILLWAYFFEKSYAKKDKAGQRAYIIGRLKHLFIVFCIWSIIYFAILADFSTITITKLATVHFSGYGWSGQYFFIILFQLLIFYPLIRYSYSKSILRYSILASVIVLYILSGYFYDRLPGGLQKISYRPFIYWLPYVYTGIFMARATAIRKLPVITALAVLILPVEYYFFQLYNISHSDYITPGILIGSTLFCVSIMQNDFNIKSSALYNAIAYLGSNTMVVFVSNPLLILGFAALLSPLTTDCNIFYQILFPFLSAIMITILSISLGVILKKTKLDKYLS